MLNESLSILLSRTTNKYYIYLKLLPPMANMLNFNRWYHPTGHKRYCLDPKVGHFLMDIMRLYSNVFL